MFEFLRKTPTVVGLDISSTAVKLLELSQDKGQYRVESYGVEVIPKTRLLKKTLRTLMRSAEQLNAFAKSQRPK